jgi:hypothetical protein
VTGSGGRQLQKVEADAPAPPRRDRDRELTFATKTVVDSTRPSASTVISGAGSDIASGPDKEQISLSSLFPVAVTGPQPSGPTGRARTMTSAGPGPGLGA